LHGRAREQLDAHRRTAARARVVAHEKHAQGDDRERNG
jgi:hypothetical protein